MFEPPNSKWAARFAAYHWVGAAYPFRPDRISARSGYQVKSRAAHSPERRRFVGLTCNETRYMYCETAHANNRLSSPQGRSLAGAPLSPSRCETCSGSRNCYLPRPVKFILRARRHQH